jgi:hypothetical protein
MAANADMILYLQTMFSKHWEYVGVGGWLTVVAGRGVNIHWEGQTYEKGICICIQYIQTYVQCAYTMSIYIMYTVNRRFCIGIRVQYALSWTIT